MSPTLSRSLSSSSIPGDDAEPGAEPQEEEEEDEDFAKGDDLAYTDDLRDENYHPSLDRWEKPGGAGNSVHVGLKSGISGVKGHGILERHLQTWGRVFAMSSCVQPLSCHV